MTVKLKGSDGAWKDIASMYLKNSSGVWKGLSSAYLKVAGSWKQIFSQVAPSIQNPVTISASSANNPSVLTGTNYHWYNISANPKYLFQKSEDGSTWTDIGTLTTISNPSVGLSNTATYTTQTSDFTQTMMYFRFIVVGVNSVGTVTQSASSSTTVSLYVAPPPTTPPPTTPPPTTPPPILTGLTPIISDGVYVTASSVKFTVSNYDTNYTWTTAAYNSSGTLMSGYTITSFAPPTPNTIEYTISGITQDNVTLRVTTSRSGYTTVYAEKSYIFPNNQVTGVTPSSGADNGTGRKFVVSWTNVPGITRYMLQFALDGTFSWTYAYGISNPFISNLYYPYNNTYKFYIYGTDSGDNIINGSQSALTYWTPTATPPPPTTPPPTTPPPTTPPPTTPPPTTPPPTTPPPTTPPPTTPPPTTPPPTTPPPTTPPPTTPPPAPTGISCTSTDRSTGTCTSIGCDSSGCGSGGSCTGTILNRRGPNC